MRSHEGIGRVFISYVASDREAAHSVADGLIAEGVDVLLDHWTLAPGEDFIAKMSEAQRTADTVLVLLSPANIDSHFSRSEWLSCVKRGRSPIPVRVKPCDLESHLGPVVYLDLVNKSRTAWGREIIDVLTGTRRAHRVSFPRASHPDAQASHHEHSFHGEIPAIWNVPGDHFDFVGRRELLRALQRDAGLDDHRDEPTVRVITGVGGVGKSALAAEFARQHRGDFDVVWWVRADADSSLSGDLSSLAETLGVIRGPDDWTSVALKLRKWCESTEKRWLLVLDNADDPDVLLGYLPQRGRGRILVTSRRPPTSHEVASLNVDALEIPAATELLLKRTGSDDSVGAASLATELGGLVLAVEQAASFVRATGTTFSEYSSLVRSFKGSVKVSMHMGAAEATTAIALSACSSRHPATEPLLAKLSFLATDAIQPRVIQVVAGDGLNVSESLRALVQFGLASMTDDGDISLHEVVRDTTRDLISSDERTAILRGLVGRLDTALPRDEVSCSAWPNLARMLPHVLAILDDASDRLSQDARVGSLYHRLARYSQVRGDSRTATRLFGTAARLYQSAGEPEGDVLGALLNDASVAYADAGDWVRAAELAAEVLRQRIEFEGPSGSSPLTVAALNNLVCTMADTGRAREALDAYKILLDVCKRESEIQPRVLLTILSNAAMAEIETGASDAAVERLSHVWTFSRALLGDDDPDTLASSVNVALVRARRGDDRGSLPLLLRAHAVSEQLYGSRHPISLYVLDALASVATTESEAASALPWAEHAYARRLQTNGDEHPQTLESLRVLSTLLWQTGRQKEAYELMQRLAASFAKLHGYESQRAVEVRDELVWMGLQLGRKERASSLLSDMSRDGSDPSQLSPKQRPLGPSDAEFD